MQSVYLNPLTDFGFKKLFGEEPHKDLLISFLNTLLPERHQIAELQYTKNEYQGISQMDRKAIFDLNCIGGALHCRAAKSEADVLQRSQYLLLNLCDSRASSAG